MALSMHRPHPRAFALRASLRDAPRRPRRAKCGGFWSLRAVSHGHRGWNNRRGAPLAPSVRDRVEPVRNRRPARRSAECRARWIPAPSMSRRAPCASGFFLRKERRYGCSCGARAKSAARKCRKRDAACGHREAASGRRRIEIAPGPWYFPTCICRRPLDAGLAPL